MRKKTFTVSVVIPAFNEEGNIKPLLEKLTSILENYHNYEILFVDDGSEDKTLENLKIQGQKNHRVRYISLSRNFGHQNALKAGLDHAVGDCIVTMDGDLQHPPELIPRLVEKWQEGYEVVTTIRLNDPRSSFLKRGTSGMFYRLVNRLSDIRIPKGAADFRLLDRSVVNILKDTKEYYLFFRGMIAWMGFHQCTLEYIPDKRFSGKSKYSFKRMFGFALTGITSFSLKPLRLSILLGLFFALLAFGYGVYAILIKLLTDQAVPGWTSVLASVLFIGGLQLTVLGIIGEYIGKLFVESKKRPHYIIKEKSPLKQQENRYSPHQSQQGQYRKQNQQNQSRKSSPDKKKEYGSRRNYNKSSYNRKNQSRNNNWKKRGEDDRRR